ncbi:hypothetical protein ABIB40_003197 [Pedobacter sp. UYP30]
MNNLILNTLTFFIGHLQILKNNFTRFEVEEARFEPTRLISHHMSKY